MRAKCIHFFAFRFQWHACVCVCDFACLSIAYEMYGTIQPAYTLQITQSQSESVVAVSSTFTCFSLNFILIFPLDGIQHFLECGGYGCWQKFYGPSILHTVCANHLHLKSFSFYMHNYFPVSQCDSELAGSVPSTDCVCTVHVVRFGILYLFAVSCGAYCVVCICVNGRRVSIFRWVFIHFTPAAIKQI